MADFLRDEPPLIGGGERRGSLLNHQTIISGDSKRILELEIENARLQRLVAELLIKNQRLRLRRPGIKEDAHALPINSELRHSP